METGGLDPGIAVDNDVIFKAVCYCSTGVFWPTTEGADPIGVLGAARYVVRALLERASLARDKQTAWQVYHAFFASVSNLEPTDQEIRLAAELEFGARRIGASLDPGESQLAAMVVRRDIPVLETGDKRAIISLEQLLDHAEGVLAMAGRIRCLEQIVLRRLADEGVLATLRSAVCGEPAVDKAMTACFACYSDDPPDVEGVAAGLDSYLNALREQAPRALSA
jgi:predicted nucleic acid-binding protein